MIAIAKPLITTAAAGSNSCGPQADRHDQFMSLLPAIRRHARVAFRHQGIDAREEAVNSTVAHAWAAFVRLCELGRADLVYASPLAAYAVARVREGRSIGSRLNARDVTSDRCRRRHGVQIESFARVNQLGEWHQIVVEDHRAGPADIAATRIDFTPGWTPCHTEIAGSRSYWQRERARRPQRHVLVSRSAGLASCGKSCIERGVGFRVRPSRRTSPDLACA